MGQKVNPQTFRLGVNRRAISRWFTKDKFAQYLKEDVKIRDFLKKKLRGAGVSLIEIERSAGDIKIIIHTSRPGMVIGRGGTQADDLKDEIRQKFLGSQKIHIHITIQEVQKPDLSAELVSQNLIEQIEKRVPFRKAMKRGLEAVERAGALGVKITMAGRLNGAEIARTESLTHGKVPLHTLRADIDFATNAAHTTYGAVGVKVWIYKGEIFDETPEEEKQ